MTDRQREIQERLDAATPGPWTIAEPARDENGFRMGVLVAKTSPGAHGVYATPPGGQFPAADRVFIAAAPSDIAWLLTELAACQKEHVEDIDRMDRAAEALEKYEAVTKAAGDGIDRLQAQLAACQKERDEAREAVKMHEDHLEDLITERLDELDAEGEAYNKEAAKALKALCESTEGFDWSDYPDGLTVQDAADWLAECEAATDAEIARLTEALAASRQREADAVERAAVEAEFCVIRGLAATDDESVGRVVHIRTSITAAIRALKEKP